MNKKLAEELKNCPFCNSRARVFLEGGISIVQCTGIGCYVQQRCISDDISLAIKKWNTRALDLDSYLEGVRKTRDGCACLILKHTPAWTGDERFVPLSDAKDLCLSYRDEMEG